MCPLSAPKTHKTSVSLTKTEVTRRILCPARALLDLKIGSVATFVLIIIQQNVHFLHISAPKAVLMGYSALYSEIIAHIMLKSRNH